MRASVRVTCGVLLLSTLAGCATLDEGQCRTVNWFDLGRRDGAMGYDRSRLGAHQEACSEFALQTDDSAWREGYEEGLLSYCTVENGFRLGRQAAHYGRVCPLPEEADFLDAYSLGRDIHDVELEMAEVSRRAESLESRLSRDEQLSAEARRSLRYQLSEAYRELSWLRRSRDRLESEWRRRY